MIAVLSRFRVANGMQDAVADAFRIRPRAVEHAPGFLWLEVFTDHEDPSVFYLLTRWTDRVSFEQWHRSPKHRDSHALIPPGLKLDPAWTHLYTLNRVEGVTGPPPIDHVVDATRLVSEHVADSRTILMFVLSRDGIVTACTRGASEVLEPAGSLDGRSLFDYMPEPDAVRLRDWLSRGEPVMTRLRLNLGRPNRAPVTFECSLQVNASVNTLIAERALQGDQRFHDELMAINEEMAVLSRERSREVREQLELRTAAEKLNRDRNAFLKVLAHELRQPIGSALTALGVLRKMHPDERLDRPRSVVERQLLQIARLVEDLADTARVAGGEITLRRSRVDLVRQLRELSAAWDATAAGEGKTLHMRLPAEELPVWGDVDRLQQVFSNLVGNAFKYTAPTKRVTISARREGQEAVVDVADEGEGIAPERLDTIFELFHRATDTGSGLGVGLAVVRALVAAHGGTVTASSGGRGAGSTFVVRLPLLNAESPVVDT